MEIEKVIRIVATFIAVLCFVIVVASHVMFPDSTLFGQIPVLIAVIIAAGSIWLRKPEKENTEK